MATEGATGKPQRHDVYFTITDQQHIECTPSVTNHKITILLVMECWICSLSENPCLFSHLSWSRHGVQKKFRQWINNKSCLREEQVKRTVNYRPWKPPIRSNLINCLCWRAAMKLRRLHQIQAATSPQELGQAPWVIDTQGSRHLHPPTHPSVHLSIHPSIYSSTHPSIHPPLHLSISLITWF